MEGTMNRQDWNGRAEEIKEEMAQHLFNQMDEDMLKPMGCHYSNLAVTKKRYWRILAEQMYKRAVRICDKDALSQAYKSGYECGRKEGDTVLEAWHTVFKTTQLSHAYDNAKSDGIEQGYKSGVEDSARVADIHEFGLADEYIPDNSKEDAYNLGCEDTKSNIGKAIRQLANEKKG